MKILVRIKILFLWLSKNWRLWLLKIEYDDKIYRTDIAIYRRLGDFFKQTEGLENTYKSKKKAIEVDYDADIYFLKQ